jgi:hypothetical protein
MRWLLLMLLLVPHCAFAASTAQRCWAEQVMPRPADARMQRAYDSARRNFGDTVSPPTLGTFLLVYQQQHGVFFPLPSWRSGKCP